MHGLFRCFSLALNRRARRCVHAVPVAELASCHQEFRRTYITFRRPAESYKALRRSCRFSPTSSWHPQFSHGSCPFTRLLNHRFSRLRSTLLSGSPQVFRGHNDGSPQRSPTDADNHGVALCAVTAVRLARRNHPRPIGQDGCATRGSPSRMPAMCGAVEAGSGPPWYMKCGV